MIIKICGLTRREDVLSALEFGADLVGMISGVPRSPRNNTIDHLKELCRDVDHKAVAFLRQNGDLYETIELIETLKPGILHLCGQEDENYRKACLNAGDLKIWQTIGIPVDQPQSSEWLEQVLAACEDPNIEHIVLDSAKGGQTGGTGLTFPFQKVVEKLGDKAKQFIYAGGLNIDTLEQLFSAVKPMGVDVASGVEESKGIKSRDKIKNFIDKVKKLSLN